MPLAHPQTDSEVTTLLLNAGTTPVVVDFFATWCGPCTMIAPTFEQLPDQFPNLKFAKVDVDKCKETQAKNNITAMPTFVCFLNGQKMDSIRGADKVLLEQFVKKWSANCPTQMECPVPGQYDLIGFVDRHQSECLNLDDRRSSFVDFMEGVGELISDCDEQLIINYRFLQPVKIHSLLVAGPQKSAPKLVKLFVNVPVTLGFDRAQSSAAVQTLDFSGEQLQALNFVRFQNVSNLQLFIENNIDGTDQTVVEKLRLYGTPLSATNMQEFKRVAGKAGEASH